MIKALVLSILAPVMLATCDPTEQVVAPETVDVSACVEYVPVGPTEVCDEWSPLYECLGATPTEIRTLNLLRQWESGCGWRLINPGSSDIGDCQLNGAAHAKPGWAFGRRWSQGWAVERFGLAPFIDRATWRSNVDYANPEGIAKVSAACLFLLRGSDDGYAGTPDAFKGCPAWGVHWQIRRGYGCGITD